MKDGWKNEIDNNLKSNSRMIVKDGKKVLTSFITWKKIQEILNRRRSSGYNISNQIAIDYIKGKGIIVPYKEKDIDYLYELAEMQNMAKELQDFEKKVCEKKIDELANKRKNKIISNKDILDLGLCTPSEVAYALNYRDLVYGKPETKKKMTNQEIISLNESKIKDAIEKIIIQKENIIIQGAVMRKIGNKNLLTNREVKNLIKRLHLTNPLSSNDINLIEKYIDEVRDKRKQMHIETGVDAYKKLCNIISTTLDIDVEDLNSEGLFLEYIDKSKKVRSDAEKEVIESLEKEYLEIRELEFYYYETFINWMAYKIKKNSYSAHDIHIEDLIEYLRELYLKTYFTYIRKYDPDNKIELTTYLINEIKNHYKKDGNESYLGPKHAKKLYLGPKHAKKLYVEHNSFVPVSSTELSNNNYYQRLIEKEINSLTSKLGRKPTTREIATSIGYSEEDVKDYLRNKELIERNVESLEEVIDRVLDDSIIQVTEEMNDVIRDLYEDEEIETLEEYDEYGIPKTEEGIIPDYMEEEEILGYDDSMIQKLIRTEYIESILDLLDEKERSIIELRFGINDGHARTLQEIADIYGVTKERIRQIEARVIAKLRRVIYRDQVDNDISDLLIDDDYFNPMSQEIKKSK